MAVVNVVGTVVGAAGVMQGSADADEAPGLIKRRLAMMSGTRKPKAADVGADVDRERVVGDERGGRGQREAARRQVHRATLAGGGVFERQRAGEAVAELGGIGPEVLARGAGITGDPHVVVAVSAAVGEEVEERLRPAHREARKLDERAIPERVEGRAAAGGIGVVFSAPKRM